MAVPIIIAGIAAPLISLADISIIGNVNENPAKALAVAGIEGSFFSAIIWIVARTKTHVGITAGVKLPGAKDYHS